LHWNITIYLGNAIKSEDGHSLLETSSVINLARLPWFRYGYIPNWLRDRLIKTFTQNQERTVRTALQDLLITAVSGSSGFQLKIAKQNYYFFSSLVNSILSLLSRKVSETSPLRDHTFLSFMLGQSRLAVAVPNKFIHLQTQQKHIVFSRIGISLLLGVSFFTLLIFSHLLLIYQASNLITKKDCSSNPNTKFFIEYLMTVGFKEKPESINICNQNLSYINLSGSVLFSKANFQMTNLQGANFSDSVLEGSNFQMTNLQGANFNKSLLINTDFTNANMRNVNLKGANLKDANLANALYLTNVQLNEAILCNTKLPSYIIAVNPNKDCSKSPSIKPTVTVPDKATTLSINTVVGEYKVVLDPKTLADAEKEGVKSVTGKFTIKPDGSFEATYKAVSTKDAVQEIKTTGKITIEDGNLVSQVETLNGEKPATTPPKQFYTLSADGKELQADGQPVKLVKQ
jgi:uncharacterized protein YjbI with pentapeptide repeats